MKRAGSSIRVRATAALVLVTVAGAIGSVSSTTAIGHSLAPRLDAAAESARQVAVNLMGGRPFQIVVMEEQRVLMSTSSPGTSLITPVPSASVSKAITAMLVMALIEEGILTLDSTLAEILPPELVPDSWRAVSVRQLLSHTSGFPADRTRWFDGSYGTCFEAYRRSVTRSAPVGPGSYDYSNTNFCTLSLLAIFATGVSYEEATYRYVFRPLRIRRQTMDAEYGNLAGAGGWRLSALDTARVISALDPDALASPLDPSTRRTMIRRTTYNYGLGVWIWDEEVFGHSGTLNRARNIAVRLSSGRVVVVLTQATYPESGLDLLDAALSIDRAYAAACAPTGCPAVGPDPFFGDLGQPLRQNYF